MEENLSKDSERLVQRNERGQLLPGSVLNPDGMKIGTTSFKTDFDEVVKDIAQEEGITISEARKRLLKVAYYSAKNGDYNFYKDISDRYYGKPKTTLELDDKRVDNEVWEKLDELEKKINE